MRSLLIRQAPESLVGAEEQLAPVGGQRGIGGFAHRIGAENLEFRAGAQNEHVACLIGNVNPVAREQHRRPRTAPAAGTAQAFLPDGGSGFQIIAGGDAIRSDGENVTVGDVTITAWDTPGHARHHHAFVIGDVCFTGDVAGMRLQGTDYISVTAAPPQFDPVAYVASVDRLAVAGFRKLYLAHFGEVTDVAAHLAMYRQRIQEVHEAVLCDHAAGQTDEQIRASYQKREHALATALGVSETDWARLEQSNNSLMCADGVHLSVKKSSHS